jgi:hypothetical protein
MELTKIKKALSLTALIISILGLVTFSLFIFEESFQVTMFGTWPAQDAGDWDLVLEGIDVLESINLGMKIVTYSIGWIQPLAFFSYRANTKANDYYIKGLKAKAFARAPHVFEGREHEFNFTPQRIVQTDTETKLINRNIIVILDKRPSGTRFTVRGVITTSGTKIIVHPVFFQSVLTQDLSS